MDEVAIELSGPVSSLPEPMGGDLILVLGGGWVALAQSVLFLRRVHASHVAITVNPAGFIHAMPDTGVAIESWEYVRRVWGHHLNAGRLRALRPNPPRLEHVTMTLDMVRRSCGAEYNFDLIFEPYIGNRGKLGDARFCSQLVGMLYGRKYFGLRKGQDVLPGHVELLTDRDDWTDVTALYKSYWIGDVAPDGENIKLLDLLNRQLLDHREVRAWAKSALADHERRQRQIDNLVQRNK